jgi:hypothetical protein
MRTVIARFQLKKKSLVVILKGLGTKTKCLSDSDSDSRDSLYTAVIRVGVWREMAASLRVSQLEE